MTDTYLITGANRGIGLELARSVVTAGGRLIAVCRQPAKAVELNALCEQSKGAAVIYAADACDATALQRIAEQELGSIDVVVCNAGVMNAYGGVEDTDNTAESISQVLMTNMAGPFFTARAFLPHLKASPRPRIAIISSYMGSQHHQGTNAYFYRASKAGANNLMVTLSIELRSDGIVVTSFHPGWVRTDMGGADAPLDIDSSCKGMVQQVSAAVGQAGLRYQDFEGNPLPW